MELVSRVFLEINGEEIDFDTVEEKEFDLAKAHPLMHKTAHFAVTSRYGASVEYPIPFDSPEFDFMKVKGGTLTIDRMNGVRVTYTGVRTLKIGTIKYDGDNAAKKSIEFSAENRQEN